MIIRIFLTVATFLLLLALVTKTPIPFLSKQVASKKNENLQIKGRFMELGTFESGQLPKGKQSIIMNDPEIYKKWGWPNPTHWMPGNSQ